MKILEIKNNLVKISYVAEDRLFISGFVIIEDKKSPYVAQIMSLKADSGINYAIVKLLFTFNEEGVVKNYDGTIPELDANITPLSAPELLDILPIEQPFMVGKLAQQNFILNIDYSVFDKNLLICSDNAENTDTLLSNIAKRTTENNDKSIIFDTTGTIEAENKLLFGKDFKLPLNYDTINYIYEHDLSDIEPVSKAVIQDILLEVQEYSKTLIDQFVPFDLFIAVIDSQAKSTGIPELTLLKSRLMKYKNENAFAQEASDIHTLRASVRGNLSTVLDISNAEPDLQNLIISTVYKELTNLDLFIYSIVKINNENSDKRLLKKLLINNKISTIIVAPHNYKYIHDLKELASNMVLFVPQTTQHDFGAYNVFLSKLNQDECVITGKATQYIPLIIEMMPIEVLADYQRIFATQMAEEAEQEVTDSFSDTSDTYSQGELINDSETPAEGEEETEEVIENSETQPEEETETTEIETIPLEDNGTEEVENSYEEENEETVTTTEEESPIEPEEELVVTEESIPDEHETEAESEPDPEPDTFVEDDTYEEEEPFVEGSVFVDEEILPETIEEPQEEEFETPQPAAENLTEDDLDFIDNLNEPSEDNLIVEQEENNTTSMIEDEAGDYTEASEFLEMEEDNILNEEQPPVVPVYPVEEDSPITGGNTEIYNPGDKVYHPKYGEGIVEKMVKFGNKILCSINFANGRRLLDPTISQLSK